VNRVILLAAAALFLTPAFAQDEPNPEDMEVVLPPDAQKCVLPASPDKIPDNATLDDLKAAKAQVATFQADIETFRTCLQQAEQNPDNTPGNKQAIINSYNYSVEMEERVAARFNDAVREYKERKAAANG
jgi:hypothetical protein